MDCQKTAEHGHVKNRWFRVSIGSVQREQVVEPLLFQQMVRSPVDNLFRIASQTMNEYLGVAWMDPIYPYTILVLVALVESISMLVAISSIS